MRGAPALVDRRTEITPEDGLIGDGCRDRNANLVLMTRALVAAAANPGVGMNVPELAKAAKIHPATVVRILGSPEARDLLLGACTEQVQLVLPKAIAALARILDDGEVAPAAKIQAAKVAFEGYKMLAQAEPAHENAVASAGTAKLFEMLALSRKRRLAVKIGNGQDSP